VQRKDAAELALQRVKIDPDYKVQHHPGSLMTGTASKTPALGGKEGMKRKSPKSCKIPVLEADQGIDVLWILAL
jgi:hypothetical protein